MLRKITEQRLIEMVQEAVKLYFGRRDYEALLGYLSEDISWIGTGKNEICYNVEEARRFFEEEQRAYKGTFEVMDEWYHVSCLTEEMGIVMVSLSVCMAEDEQKIIKIPLRFSAVWRPEEDGWKIVHIHNSVPDQSLDNQNYFNPKAVYNGYQLAVEQLTRAADMEQMTGIYNMEGFLKASEQSIRREPERRFAIVKFGVRNFRYINRTYGYAMGDQVLKSIAKNLNLSCEEHEVCGRIEKDNFGVLYYFRGKAELEKRLGELQERLVDREILDELGTEIHFQAGVYIPEDSKREKTIDMLDKALIAQRSRNRVAGSHLTYFENWMMDYKDAENRMLECASTAIENDAFELYIQPQFDIPIRQVVAGEALSRWNMNGDTPVSPGEYIPLFEEHGLIIRFDFYMLDKLCKEMRRWLDEGWKLFPISINQSRLHTREEGYLDRFCRIVDSYGIPHRYLAFELTESAFVDQGEKMQALADELHERGFLLAIDDFGTGYASLDFLSSVAADILKIDKILLQDFDCNPRLRVILEKVVELAHQMDMVVVCEGVETETQLEYLKKLGCDIGQGFLIGRPIKAEEFQQLLPRT